MFFARIILYIFLALGIIWFYNSYPMILGNERGTLSFPSVPLTISAVNQIEVGSPTKLIIPKLGVNTEIQPVGKTKSGNLDVPKSLKNVGWYKDGVRPGQFGNAVIDGHEVDEFGLGVVFKNLHKLDNGDKIYIETEDGDRLTFVVNRNEVYDYDSAPLSDIFGASTSRNLNLITCNGDFDYKMNTKDKRLVVYASMLN